MRGEQEWFEMNFCTVKLNEVGMYEYDWCGYRFDPDLVSFLHKWGRLPVESIEEPMVLIKKVMNQKEQLAEKKQMLVKFEEEKQQYKYLILKCTFVEHGAKKVAQEIYQCKACSLEGNKGLCRACLESCHAGHRATIHDRSGQDLDDDTIYTPTGYYGRSWSKIKGFVMRWDEEKLK